MNECQRAQPIFGDNNDDFNFYKQLRLNEIKTDQIILNQHFFNLKKTR